MDKEPHTYAFFSGSFLWDPWYWDLTRRDLERRGHNSLVVRSPYDDLDATFDDHKDIALDQLKNEENLVLVGYSRGANIAARVAAELVVEELVMLCPSLQPSTTASLKEPNPDIAELRKNFEAYENGLRRHPNGLWTIDREVARHRLLNKVKDIRLREMALDKLQPQRRSDNEPPLLEWPSVPVSYVISSVDRAITPAWAEHDARNVLKVEPHYIPADHSPFLSWPEGLAGKLVELSLQ